MPTALLHMISVKATDYKRVFHFVLEDADIILKSHNELIKKFLNLADQVLRHRNCPKSIQLIMCAQHWTVQMKDILLKLNQVPTVCIGNYLEAALYGRNKFSMKFLDSNNKESSLQKVLDNKYKFTKSVLICNEDEVEDIQTFFTVEEIEYMS
ncbi:unnamed protein product [Ceutorhynchus assimilis]|uniref:RNA helicase n=1 Tax=Ceutorhynchus assimilis TaxID=467358 RepID=A0A9N9MFJ3_9CUCU|nr:unnamed protein product [Ceutorhynchus assimilis]